MNKKKIGCFMLSAMLATSVTIPQALAVKQDTAKTYQLSLRVDGMSVYMLNEKMQELPAIFYNDSYYISLRTAGEWLGKNVSWNRDTKTISFTGTTQPKYYKASDVNTNDFVKYTSGGDVNITQRDDITVLIDGKEQKFYTESNNIIYPIMYNDSTYLPVRSIANLLNMSIDWKNATETTAAQISLTSELSDEQNKAFNEYKTAVQTQFEKYTDLASGLYPNKANSDELKKILGNMDECLDNVLKLNVDIPQRQNVIDLVNNTAKNQKQMIDEAYSAIKTQTTDELFSIEHGQATGILMKLYTASEVSNTLGALGVSTVDSDNIAEVGTSLMNKLLERQYDSFTDGYICDTSDIMTDSESNEFYNCFLEWYSGSSKALGESWTKYKYDLSLKEVNGNTLKFSNAVNYWVDGGNFEWSNSDITYEITIDKVGTNYYITSINTTAGDYNDFKRLISAKEEQNNSNTQSIHDYVNELINESKNLRDTIDKLD